MKVFVHEQCAQIEFSSEKANSFSRQMLADLAESITENQKQVKVILLKSSGDKAFSAGASFDEFKAISTKAQAESYFSGFMQVLEAIRNSTAIVVCRVQGKAVGGAVGIIAACDYVFAQASAELKLSELELGIGPFTISPALERKLGTAKFSEMLYDASWKNSAWALDIGLYNRVFTDISRLDIELELFIKKLCEQSKATLSANRKLLWSGTDNWPNIMKERIEIVSSLLLDSKK